LFIARGACPRLVLFMTRNIAAVAWLSIAAGITSHAAGPVTLAVPGRANANVSLASHARYIVAAWSASTADGSQTDIVAAVSRDGGRTFASPVRVNSTGADARANGEQPPRVAITTRSGAEPEITVFWVAKRGESTLLLTARSADGGRSFGASSIVGGTVVEGNRGWHSIASADGALYGVWLDHRRLAAHQAAMPGPAGATHQHGGIDPNLSDLYFARLEPNAAPRPLTSGVCYCCKTAIAASGGEVRLAWRHVFPGNHRDIAFSASRDGGRTFSDPVRISEDRWAIAGCPDDGPAMAVDGQGRTHIVWPTVVTERGETIKAIFHASTRDGRTFSARQRVPTLNQANHPHVAIDPGGSLVVAWDESGDGSRRVAMARGTADETGRVSFVRREWPGARPASYPVLSTTADSVLLAWTSGAPSKAVIQIDQIEQASAR
jgi:hypothetical protein